MKTLTALIILALSTISINASNSKHLAVNKPKLSKPTCSVIQTNIENFKARYENKNSGKMSFYLSKLNSMKKEYNKHCK